MTTQSVEVAGKYFPSKKALQEYIRSIVSAASLGAPLPALEATFLIALVARHPFAEQKLSPGCAAVVVRANPIYPATRTVYLVRPDDSEEDVSWRECITPSTRHAQLLRAARAAIESQTMRFRRWYFQTTPPSLPCPINGSPVIESTSHVDHEPPLTFAVLFSHFLTLLKTEGMDMDLIEIHGPGAAGCIQDRFADRALEYRWQEYHEAHARLRMTSASGNIKQSGPRVFSPTVDPFAKVFCSTCGVVDPLATSPEQEPRQRRGLMRCSRCGEDMGAAP